MQSLCTSLASKEGAVISPAATVALGGVTWSPSFFHSRRSLRASLKPASSSPLYLRRLYRALLRSLLPFFPLARAHTRMHIDMRTCICMTRDSSTSTIRRVRRSTPPRFNIQTICNNFAATIISPPTRAHPVPPFRFCSTLAFSVAPTLSFVLLHKPSSSASPSLPFIPSSLPCSPCIPTSSSPFFPVFDRVSSTARRDMARSNTHLRETLRLLHGVHRTFIFHPATAIILNRRAGINI